MRLIELRIRNFMPFKADQRIEFPVDGLRNVLLIFGDNMRGKTSLLNAVRWVFYGKAIDRYGDVVPTQKIVNVDAAHEGDFLISVEISFEHDGYSYLLVRKADKKRGVGTPVRPEDFQHEVHLRKDGEVIRADLVDSEIARIVPEQISRFFLFDGELLQEYETLLAEDGGQGKRIKEAIEDVLGVPALSNGRLQLASLRKKYERQASADLKSHENVRRFTEALQNLGQENEVLDRDMVAARQIHSEMRKEYSELQELISSSESVYVQKVKLDGLQKSLKQMEQMRSDLEDRRMATLQNAWLELLKPKLEGARQRISRQYDEGMGQLQASSRNEAMTSLRKALLKSGHCDVCEQDASDQVLNSVRASLEQIETAEREFEEKSALLSDLRRKERKLGALEYPSVREDLSQIAKEMRRLAVEETSTTNVVDELRRQLEGFDSEATGKARRKSEAIHHAIREAEASIADIEKRLEENRRRRDAARLALSDSEDAKDLRSTRILNLVSNLEQVFSEAIGRLRDELRAVVEKRATEAFLALTTEQTYRTLRINQNYGLTIVDEKGRDVALRSAGAEQIVALSLIDGLNRTGRSAGPVLMDTPFGRLDPKHRAKVLGHLPEASSQVALFVHEGEVQRGQTMDAISSRIGAVYTIQRVSSSQSRIVRETGA
ncbi:MAG: AAA family ATPase [Xanthomonadales bacterium]|nr:AAA family ATPase [Xanthomonadales bacterium]